MLGVITSYSIHYTKLYEKRKKFLFPGIFQKRPQFLDGFHIRVFGQNQIYGKGIVGIDEKGKLPVFVPAVKRFPGNPGKFVQTGLERVPVFQETGIADL